MEAWVLPDGEAAFDEAGGVVTIQCTGRRPVVL